VERVTGIGGVFFRARDPDLLATWYADHLGIDPPPDTYETSSWWQQPGPTVFTGMAADSEHFGGSDRQWAINFRVSDLNAIVHQLRASGIEVDVDPQSYPNGRFANLVDPEENPVQLWQPAGADLVRPS
jgi:glyoxylase I family protein